MVISLKKYNEGYKKDIFKDVLFVFVTNHYPSKKTPMNLKKLLLALFLIPLMLSAKTLSKSELKELGLRAFQQKAMSMCPQAENPILKDCDFISEGGAVCMAVLHFEQGFLVLSAEDAVMPVLAYDFTHDLDLSNPAPAVERLLTQYREEITATRRLQLPPTERIRDAWEALRRPERSTTATTIVAPLITSSWNQNKYYNYYSPQDENSPGGYDGKTPNGCVAVAMSQIIFYYRYPETGSGSHTNHTYDYGSFYVNFAEQHYNYDAMEDQLHFYNNEVAKLIFHCATAVDMHYGADGSGAYSQNVPSAMSTYFKYSFSAHHDNKSQFSTSEWHSKLKTDLDERRPLYYSGYSEEGGHAFICDGYDSEDFFHFNFGWGGVGNGFYLTEGSDNAAVNGYSDWQSAIFNLHPRNELYPAYCNERIITASNGTLEDGSGIYDYQNNNHCTYVITHKRQYAVIVHLQHLFSEAGHDYLRFWNGHPDNDSLLLELSGTIGAAEYNFPTDSLYITFETDDSVTAQGWRLSYQSNREGFGCGTHITHDPDGVIYDNSGDDDNYRDNQNCSWMIRIPDVPFITFTFEQMNISAEDHLDFYDLVSTQLLDSYTGNTIPAPVTYYTNKIRVNFVADNYLSAEGFRVSWSTSHAGVADFCTTETISPNPASEMLHITLGDELEQCSVTLYDMVGNAVYTGNYSHTNKMDIPVHTLSNGIYIVNMESKGYTSRKKIVIKH